MDYDETDFQNQNFQLGSEDNSKFPSGLRSFPLPNFDLDEHLQPHLRFDGLGGPGDLLRIPVHEDSNWIEEFSSADSAIEFTSAPESGSLSRQNNVWSEAISSESVEMLLRSVGEDGMIETKTSTDALVHDVIELTTNMDTSSNTNDSRHIEIGTRGNSDSTLQLCEGSGVLGPNKDVPHADISTDQNINENLIGEQPISFEKSTPVDSRDDDDMVVGHPSASGNCTEIVFVHSPLGHLPLGVTSSEAQVTNVFTETTHVSSLMQRMEIVNVLPCSSVTEKSISVPPDRQKPTNLVREECPNDSISEASDVLTCSQQEKTQVLHAEIGTSPGYTNIETSVNTSCSTIADPSLVSSEICREASYSKMSDHLLEVIVDQMEIPTDVDGLKLSPLVPASHEKSFALTDDSNKSAVENLDMRAEDTDAAENTDASSFLVQDTNSVTVDTVVDAVDLSTRAVNLVDGNAVPVPVISDSIKSGVESGGDQKDPCNLVAKVGNLDIDQIDQSDLGKHEKQTSGEPELALANDNSHDELGTAMITEVSLDDGLRNAKGENIDCLISLVNNVADVPASTENVASVELCQADVPGSASHVSTSRSSFEESTKFPTDETFSSNIPDSSFTVGKTYDVINRAPDDASRKLSNGSPQRDNVLNDSVLASGDGSMDMEQSDFDGIVNLKKSEASTFSASESGTGQWQEISILECSQVSQNTTLQETSSGSKLGAHDESKPSEGHAVAKPSEAGCSPPAIIRCNEESLGEREHTENAKGLYDQSSSKIIDTIGACSNENKDSGPESTSDTIKKVDTSEDGKSFTIEAGQISEISLGESVDGWKPLFGIQPTQSEQEIPAKCTSQEGANMLKESSHGSQLVHDEGKIRSRSTGKDKSRSPTTRASVSKRKPPREKVASKKIAERIQASHGAVAISLGALSRDLHSEEMQQRPLVEGCNMNLSSSPLVQTSNLPDLNTATASLFNQPFTDLQQVQLRAQIFVYGSLIQDIPPDEACMVSAFGETGGGRGTWEGIWHAVAEKFQNKKSLLAGCETPHSANKVLIQIAGSTPVQSKVLSTPPSRVGNEGLPSTVYSSMPLPLWSNSTRDGLHSGMPRGSHVDHNQIVSPSHAYQSPHIRPYASSSSWLTPNAFPVPRISPSHSSAAETSVHHSALPFPETAQLTPLKSMSTPDFSNVTFSSSFPAVEGAVSVSTVAPTHLDANKEASLGRAKLTSTDKKSRRRKKTAVIEALGQILPVLQRQTEHDSVPGVSNSLSFSSLPHPSNKDLTNVLVSNLPPITSPTHFQIVDSSRTEQKVIFSGEMCSKLEQAKLQAEDAVALAAVAVKHSEGMWNQLASKKNSGSNTEVECKLASAAVAAAAAASVAKAAAAVARLAADSALQAKLMADEALVSGNASYTSEIDVSNSSKATPVSTLKGKELSTGSYSVIPAAREAARRRVEAASAATKRAENLDAIVKAAELVAEAVTQAGAIVAMGDPLHFTISEIIEAGPGAYWKIQHLKAEQQVKTNNTCEENQPVLDNSDGHDRLDTHLNLPLPDKNESQQPAEQEISHSSNGIVRDGTANYPGISSTVNDVEIVERDQSVVHYNENNIQEGSFVEVMSQMKGLGDVWYTAHVLNLKDSEVYVCYDEPLSAEGSEKLKEWISFDSENEKAPRIRIAHPMTLKKPEGTRKRRRAAVGAYTWVVGDRVDVWIGDGWREGVVKETSKEDETKLIIHFPATGDTLSVRSWDLRPTLVWKEGHWIDWSLASSNNHQYHENDTPHEKRQKLSNSETKIHSGTDAFGARNINVHTDEFTNPDQTAPLLLSAKEKAFSLGKVSREGNNPERMKRMGLQKEGSRVVIGVPRPGKKRKFMDVSKHCVVENTEKTKELSDPMKFTKFLMPQSSNNGWKNVSKVDPRSRRPPDPRPKVSKSAKSLNVQSRRMADKDNPTLLVASSDAGRGNLAAKCSSRHAENSSFHYKMGQTDGSQQADGSFLSSRLHCGSETPSIDKPLSDDSEHVERAKSVRTGEKLNRSVLTSDKQISDSTEPRRSNRKIQPTSRLLEGLQSSLIISKLPSASHRTGPSSRGNVRG